MFLYENILNMRYPDKLLFVEHLSKLIIHFQNYFPVQVQQRWNVCIKNLFFIVDLLTKLSLYKQKQMIHLSSNSVMKPEFEL